MRLIGEKIVLRNKKFEDAWLDYQWRCDAEIANLDAAFPLKMKFEEFLRMIKDQLRYPTPASGRFGIETLDGKYIGNCMYYDMDTVNKQAEIGIVIGDKEYWNGGYGSDAVATILEYLFSRTSMKRLYLHTLVSNKRAQRAFKKCGLLQVSSVLRNGMEFILMDITKERWVKVRENSLAGRDAATVTSQE